MGKKMVEIGAVELRKLKLKIAAEEKKKAKKAERRFDGFSPFLQARVRAAIREVWMRASEARKLVVKRCSLPDGYFKCEMRRCAGKRYPKIFVDHIVPAGALTSPRFLDRMFVSSKGLQGLCHDCHKIKTAEDKKGFW